MSAASATAGEENISSRIIRGGSRLQKLNVSSNSGTRILGTSEEHVMDVEKQAFEQGYAEGERIGKQMGEKMVEAIVNRYEASIVQLAEAHQTLVGAVEQQTVQLALEISRKIVQRELTVDTDIVTALASVALKRVSSHQAITLRVSRQDFGRARVAIANINPAITVKADATLERGDFAIDTAQTHLDGRIGSQIDAISRALFDE